MQRNTTLIKCKIIILALISATLTGFAGNARAGLIEFNPSSPHPNGSGSPNTNASGSDALVSVGYSEYTYAYPSGYGGLDGGTGAAIYSSNGAFTLIMTFTAAAGNTVTLNSFNLAQYSSFSDAVDISVTGGDSSYGITGASRPAEPGTSPHTRRTRRGLR